MATVAQLIIELRASTDKLVTDLGQSVGAVKKAQRQLGDVGRNLTQNVTLPILGIAAAAVKSSIEFESAFANVKKTFDETGKNSKQVIKELGALEKGVVELSKRMPTAASEIANVAANAQQLGIKSKDVLKFTETIIKLGETTDLSSERAAFALARFATVTQMSAKDYEKLGSTIVDLGNKFAATESEITEMAARLAGAGNVVGLSQAEILALATALSAVGIEAQAGGTSFSKFLINMRSSLREGGKEAQLFASVMGTSLGEAKQLFETDTNQAIAVFLDGLKALEENRIDSTKVIEELGLSEVRLRDALLRTSGAQGLVAETTKVANAAWENGTALQNEYSKRLETSAAKLSIFRNIISASARVFGDLLLPKLIAVAQSFADLAVRLANLSPRMQNLIINVALFAAALGPVALILRGMIGTFTTLWTASQLLGKGFAALPTIISLLGQGFYTLGAGAKLVVGVFSPLTGIVTTLLSPLNILKSLIIALSPLWITLGGAVGIFLAFIEKAGGNVPLFLQGFVQLTQNALASVGEAWEILTILISAAWEEISTAISDGANFIKSKLEEFAAYLIDQMPESWRTALNQVIALFNGFKNGIVEGLDFLRQRWEGFLSNFRKGMLVLGKALNVTAWQQWALEAEVAARKAKGAADKDIKPLEAELGKLKTTLEKTAKAEKEVGKETEEVGNKAEQTKPKIDKFFDSFGKGKDKATKALKELNKEWDKTQNEIKKNNLQKSIEEAVKSGNSANLDPLFNKMKELHKDSILEGLKESAAEAGEAGRALAERIAETQAEAYIKAEKEQIARQLKESRQQVHQENVDFWQGLMEDAITGTRFDWEEQFKKAAVRIGAEFLAQMTNATVGTGASLSQILTSVIGSAASGIASLFGFSFGGGGGGANLGSYLQAYNTATGGGSGGSGSGLASGAYAIGGTKLAADAYALYSGYSAAGGAAGLSSAYSAGAAGVYAPGALGQGGATASGYAASSTAYGYGQTFSAYATPVVYAAGLYAGYEGIKGFGDNTKETSQGLGVAGGAALGASVGGWYGAAIGAVLGLVAGDLIGGMLMSKDKDEIARDAITKYINQQQEKTVGENDSFKIFNSQNQLTDPGRFQFTNFAEYEQDGQGNFMNASGELDSRDWSTAFWQDFEDKGATTFNALGITLAELSGLGGEVGGQLGAQLAEYLDSGTLEGNLDNIKIFLDSIGVSAKQLVAEMFDLAMSGQITWHEFEVFRMELEKIPEAGFVAAGAIDKAMEQIRSSAGRGQGALAGIRNLAIEIGETGAKSLGQMRDALINAGVSAEDVEAIMYAFAQRGIKNLDDLKNASDATLGGIVADLHSAGFAWEEMEGDIGANEEGVEKLDGSIGRLAGNIDRLSNAIERIPNGEYTVTERRKVIDEQVTANANGGVYGGNSVRKFASGGVFHSPQFFNYSGGRLGMLGEAGPEAILPLKRINGKLGVSADGLGGGSGDVIVNIDASGAHPGVHEQIANTLGFVIDAAAQKALLSLKNGSHR